MNLPDSCQVLALEGPGRCRGQQPPPGPSTRAVAMQASSDAEMKQLHKRSCKALCSLQEGKSVIADRSTQRRAACSMAGHLGTLALFPGGCQAPGQLWRWGRGGVWLQQPQPHPTSLWYCSLSCPNALRNISGSSCARVPCTRAGSGSSASCLAAASCCFSLASHAGKRPRRRQESNPSPGQPLAASGSQQMMHQDHCN